MIRVGAAILVALVLAVGITAMVRGVAAELNTPVELPRVAYATSATCVPCHPGRFETWHRTFHRTMTQGAGPTAVLGDFADARLDYQGVTSRFTREGARYVIETLSPGGAMERHEVVLTVGSRRIQQYVARIGGRHVRLPLAWNIEERRWIHLNGGFLHPDGSDFNTHRADWDNNCIFCHNVKAQPRYDERSGAFDPRVAELGIACEACHGPADLHVRCNADPLRRYLLYLGGRRPGGPSPRRSARTPSCRAWTCASASGRTAPRGSPPTSTRACGCPRATAAPSSPAPRATTCTAAIRAG